jgi:selenocysteine-specific elongation factor
VGRRFVIGTAGHIDHGKTALVKALTGVDTDRWEEEKRRGITIDLGFAPLPLAADVDASVVDVPGHEGFVRNMLAGATGIDVALLVIAADEGIMPQTEEHLAIVELLGVQRGIPVLSKADTVDDDWLQLVREEVTRRLAASRIRWEPAIATSALSGRGLDELRAALVRLAAELVERSSRDLFRLPIDRVFALPGAGTVVTGSTWSGTVAAGDVVRLLPLDREVRVRSVESHGSSSARAEPGSRTALALVGVDKDELARGHVAVTGPGWRATRRLDVQLELLGGAPRPLAARTRVRIHLGTDQVLARVAPVADIAPGASGLARLVLEQPLVARGGDRFVVRSYSPVTTIGGGIVLDPHAPPRPRLPERRLATGQPLSERLLAWIAEAGLTGIPERDLGVRLGIAANTVTEIIAQAGKAVLASDGALVGRAAVAEAAERLSERVQAHHVERPLEPGLPLETGRSSVSGPVADLVIDLGARKRLFEVVGAVLRRPGWAPSAEGGAEERLMARLAAAGLEVPTVPELERDLPGVPVRALLAHLARTGGVVQIDRERYATKDVLEAFRAALEAALAELQSATPAQLRDRLGLTRKYLIPLLEWADRRGITRRTGDTRSLARLTAGNGGF